MHVNFKKCEAIIVKLAHQYIYKFANNTVYNLDDLISEGWIIYLNCLKKKDEIRVEFTTYLYAAVENRFKSIYRNENVYKKRRYEKTNIDDFEFESNRMSPENVAMAIQAIIALSEVSYDFATMVIEGVPKDLLFVARSNMRSRRIGNKFKKLSGSISFPKRMLEDYFKIDIDNLRILVSKYF